MRSEKLKFRYIFRANLILLPPISLFSITFHAAGNMKSCETSDISKRSPPPPSVTESKCAQICSLFYFLYKFRFVQFCQCKVKKFVTTKSPPHTANLCIRSSRSSHVQVGQYRRANKIPAQHNKFPFEVQFFILCFTVNFIFFLYVYP